MATLINGNGNCPVTAQQDADFFQGILGGSFVKMLPVGGEMAYTVADANTITLSDGECIDAEGRRIHIDVGNTDSFTIPTGTSGSTAYYIIGYYLSEDSDGNETASTFVEEVDSASSTLSESSLRDGASGKYVSLYRVTQESLAIASVEALYTTVTGLTGKLDGETLVTDYNTAVTATETGTAPDCTVIAAMYANFLAGCSAIANAITSAGVATATNASVSAMANNIASVYNTRYAAGYNAGYAAAMVGNASASHVLNGRTFTNAGGVNIVGTMNNWGSNSVSMSSNTATLYGGYYANITINAAARYTAGYNTGYKAGNAAGYNARTMTVTSLGTKTTTSAKANFTFNAANISGYGNLTVSNFAITNQIMTVTAGGSGSGSDGWNINISISNTCTPKLAYNASNGILTVSNCYSYGACTNTITTTAYAYISSLTVKAYVC